MGTITFKSRIIYRSEAEGGAPLTGADRDYTLTTNETDDGFYNVGDEQNDSGPNTEYQGTFESGGHTFVVFHDTQAPFYSFIYSETASVGDFPSSTGDYPASYTPGSITLDPSPYPVCFAPGTRIATPDGDRTVETLAIGDLILTETGAAVPITWIGRQTITKFFAGTRAQPVRIRAGALGQGSPYADLTVTGNHGILLDGLVIDAGALVNGSTIDWVPLAGLPERVVYYHIETEAHDVIFANGAAAETFVDYVGRQAFDNYAEYLELFGSDRVVSEMQAPRISAQRLVPRAIKERLNIVTPETDRLAHLIG